jgi:hypothetical protein
MLEENNDDEELVSTGYTPRNPQKLIHQMVKDNRFTVVVAHRRMGKTVSAINQLVHSALLCEKPSPRLAYIAPTYAQCKRIAWDYLLTYTRPLGAIANIAELRVDFMGRRISLYGADNPDSLRGIYLDGVVIDEIGDINPTIFSEVVRPALADRLGWAMFIGTPKGNNHFKDLRDRADKGNDSWKLLEFKASDTKLLDPQELASARNEMGDDKFQQEFECSFNAAVEGSYYGQLINDLEAKNQITTIPRETLSKTYCAWDLGMSDSTAIWVAQVVGKEIRLVDFYENHSQGLDTYVQWLRDNGWSDAVQLLPHDVVVRELGTGKSRQEMLEQAGLEITVVKKLPIADGIQAVRRLLPRCWFDKNVKQGLDALRNYRRNYDEKRNVFFDSPLHDWCSHASDAFRYLAVGLDESDDNWGQPLTVNNSWIV